MKILLMDFGSVVNSVGGTEKVLCNMANVFSEKGHSVTILCCDEKEGKPFFQLSKDVKFINLSEIDNSNYRKILYRIEKEILRTIGRLDTDEMYIKTNFNRNRLKILEEILSKFLPDIIITFDKRALMVLKNVLHNTLPTIAMLHRHAAFFFNDRSSKYLLNAYNSASCITVLNNESINIATKYIDSRIVYLPNMVELPNCNMRNYSKCNYKIISVGKINKGIKRQHLLIEAFNKVKDKFPEWKIEIAGDASNNKEQQYKNDMLSYIEKNNMNDKVVFLGNIKKVIEQLEDADIFVIPSSNEGMPLCLLEAMSSGMPVLGYKECPSVNEIIRNEHNGYLVDKGVDDLASKLVKLMSNHELRKNFGKNAYKDMEQFKTDNIYKLWIQLINTVIKNA